MTFNKKIVVVLSKIVAWCTDSKVLCLLDNQCIHVFLEGTLMVMLQIILRTEFFVFEPFKVVFRGPNQVGNKEREQ